MPKKTARRTRKHRKSPSKKVGLIATEKNADQSAKTESALDNHFHRTALPISCGVTTLPVHRSRAFDETCQVHNAMTFLLKTKRRQLHGLVMQRLFATPCAIALTVCDHARRNRADRG